MKQGLPNSLKIAFGDFELYPAEASLTCRGEPVPLAPKEFELLYVLVSHAGHLVHKETLIQDVWPDTFVSDSSLFRNVSVLRKYVGNDSIRTVPKRGYIFTPLVTELWEPGERAPATLIQEGMYEPNGVHKQKPDRAQAADSSAPQASGFASDAAPVMAEHRIHAPWLRWFRTRKRLAALPLSLALVALAAAVLPSRLVPYVHRPHPARARAGAIAITFVYVVDYSRSQVLAYTVDQSSRTLVPADMGPFKSGEHPYAAALSPDGGVLYVAHRGRTYEACGEGCSISAYAVDQHNGALTELDGSPHRAGFGPVSLAVPSGKYLYVANVDSNNVMVYVRHPNGGLEPLGKPVPVGRQPFFVAATPSGKFVYVSNHDDATVSGFAVADGGTLKAVPGSPFSTGLRPRSITIDPEGRFAYVVNYGVNPFSSRNEACAGTFEGIEGKGCTISVFKIDPATGALTHIGGSPFESDGINPLASVMTASGRYLFVTNITSNNVSVYERDQETGAIRAVNGSPFQADKGPVSAVLDSSDIYLYVANAYSHNISEFEIEEDGRLRLLRKPIAAGSGPAGIVAQR